MGSRWHSWLVATLFSCLLLALFSWSAYAEDPIPRTIEKRKAPATGGVTAAQSTAPSVTDSTRAALVVGNSAYAKLRRLPSADKDARDMCEALKRLGFKTSCYYDLASRAFRETIQNFVLSLTAGETVFIYYAGHGVQSSNENYLLPVDADFRSATGIEDEDIGLTYLLRLLEGKRSGPNIVILDACREMLRSESPPGLSRGLVAIEPPPDTLLVYATAPNQNAYEYAGEEIQNGFFAKHLLAHLEDPGITVDQLFSVVAESVMQEARANNVQQLPYRNSALSTILCLETCGAQPSAKELEQINQLNTQLTELRSRYSQRETEIEQLRELKKRYDQRESEIQDLQKHIAERDALGATLQARIQALQRDSTLADGRTSERDAELTRLRSDLAAAQEERKRDIERLEQQNARRDNEMAELRAREIASQKLAQEVEQYRHQVEQLQKEKVELLRRATSPGETAKSQRVIVPSF